LTGDWVWRVGALVAAYLIGSVPIGLILVRRLKGIDIRESGSGNIGATNVWRVTGSRLGVSVFFLDCAKGVAAASFGRLAAPDLAVLHVLAGMAGIAGNNWSVFLRFKGGRGVSISLGVLIALTPKVALVAFLIFLAGLLATRYVSVTSIVAALSVPVLMFVFHQPTAYQVLGIACCAFVLVRHIPNIRRLIAGTEPRIPFGGKRKGDGR
jgi:glycerol-3-phosphate acyltransferase PlsY